VYYSRDLALTLLQGYLVMLSAAEFIVSDYIEDVIRVNIKEETVII
jgi:hypothetical protein